VTGSRPSAATTQRFARPRLATVGKFASQAELSSSGLNRKARLLLLCARIGYTPHASFQR